jgi:ABC-type transport system involved in multi-copper enzyme maturation permease subunit
MIKDLYIKEIRQYLYSGKIIFATVVILTLFVINALMCQRKYEQMNLLYNQEKLTNEENVRKSCSSFYDLLFVKQQSVKPPSHVAFICDASANKLDDAVAVNAFRLSSLGKLGPDNPYFSSFTSIDWTSIILIVFSFLSISLCYNAFCGERVEGTLKLILSNNVSRWKVFIVKYLGILSALTIPLLIGILLHLLVISIGGKIELDLNDYLLILFFLVLSVLFTSFNVLLFLFISVATSRPVVSLSISLITWLLLQVVIPQVLWTSSKMIVKIPTFSQVSSEDQKQSESIRKSPGYYNGWNSNWQGKAPNEFVLKRAALLNALDVSHNQIWGEYTQKLFRQTNFAMDLCKISPYSIYGFIGAIISDNGFSGLKNFYTQSENYRGSLYKFLIEKDKADPKSYHLVINDLWSFKSFISNSSLRFEEIPLFEYKRPSSVKALTELKWDISIIILWSMVLFSGGLIVFIRSDVR